jgi:diguanylate cyclase (GGDEF)-like protein/PAS domain S-box-containing protein
MVYDYSATWYVVALTAQSIGIIFVLIITTLFNNIKDQMEEIENKSKIIEEKNLEMNDSNIKLEQSYKDIKRDQRLIESIFDSIPGLLYVYDESERLIKWNRKHETMTGFTAEELSSMTLENWFDENDLVKVRATVQDVFEKGYGEEEGQLIIKGGDKLTIQSSFAPLILDGTKYFAGISIDITERKKMESELIEKALQLQTMMETTQDGFWIVDLMGRITDANQSYCEMTGYTKEELLGIKIGDLDIYESSQETAARIEGMIENKSALFETCHKRKDGSVLHLEISATFVGMDVGIFAFCRNIDERKTADMKIQETMRDLLESQQIAHLGTWRFILATNQVVWSEELYHLYGFDPTAPPPPFTEQIKLFTPASWKKLSSSLEQTRTIGTPCELELETVNQDGSNGWMLVRGEASKDSNGKIISIFGASQDITVSKKMEYEVRQSEEKFQLLFNKAPLGYQSLDSEGRFIEVNQKWLETLGYTREEVIGKWFGDFLCPEDVEGFQERFSKFKAQGSIYSEFEMPTKNGERLIMAFDGKIGNDFQGCFTQTHCILQNVTNQKKAEKALIESEERYKALFKNAGVGIFYYSTEGIALSANRLALANIGIKLENYVGKSIGDLFPKKVAELYFTRINKAILSDKSREYEDYLVFNSVPKWFLNTFTRVVNINGEVLGVQIASLDISKRKMAEDELRYLSEHDHLTGLYNRRFYEKELDRLDTNENLPLSIIMCDINGLKLVNDSFGHDAGDQIIKKVTKAISDACREGDIIARTGGDEFDVILPRTTADEAMEIANNMRDLISREKIKNIDLSISCGHDTKTTDKESIIEIRSNAENYMYRNKLTERASMRSKTIDIIMNTLFEKSSREAAHSNRVGKICESIAFKLNLERDTVNQMRIAGLIHDIGKIGIDEKILNKPASLNLDEIMEIQRHPEIGWRLLSATTEFSELAQFVLNHHEKWDGSGYPNRIKGEEIPLEARIICVADSYDAMTSQRSYRKALSKEAAIKELMRCSGTQFDPSIIDVFVNQVVADL